MPPKRKTKQKVQKAPAAKKTRTNAVPKTKTVPSVAEMVPLVNLVPSTSHVAQSEQNPRDAEATAHIVSAVVEELIKRKLVAVPQASGSQDVVEENDDAQSANQMFVQGPDQNSPDPVRLALYDDQSAPDPVRLALHQGHYTQEATGLPIGIPTIASMGSYQLRPSVLVPDKTKQAIWKNEFVEMTALLPKHNMQNDVSVMVKLSANGEHDIALKPAQADQKMLNINQWLTAFHIYMDIFLETFPADLPGLLAYCSLVRDLERTHGQAARQFYDRTFRAHRQTQALPWAMMHTELYVKAMSLATTHSATAHSYASGKNNAEKHFSCNQFNKHQCIYKPCKYPHVCSYCGKKGHPRFKCYQLNRTNSTSNTYTAAPSALSDPGKSGKMRNTGQPFRYAHANTNKK